MNLPSRVGMTSEISPEVGKIDLLYRITGIKADKTLQQPYMR
jgi:hypothetical protein